MTLDTSRISGDTGHLADHNTLHKKANLTLDIVADFGAVADDGTTDNLTAIQDAIDELESAGGGKLVVPAAGDPNNYFRVSAPLTVNGDDIFFEGVGPASQIRSNDSSVLKFATTSAVTRFTMRDMMLRVAAANSHCMEVSGVLSESLFQNNYYSVFTDTSSTIYASGSSWELLDSLFLRNTYDADSNGSTVPVVDLVDTAGGICNVNTFLGGRFIGSTSATAPLVRLSCQAANYMGSNTFQGVNFQTNPAGAMLMQGNAGTLISGCGVFDIGTATDHMFEVGKHASGLASQWVQFINTLRHGGSLSTFSDIFVSGANHTIINGSGANTGGKVDLGGHRGTLINPAASDLGDTSFAVFVDGPNDRLGPGQGRQIKVASGTPEGNVTATVGSLFLRTDGGAGTSLYVKESGTGDTGWVGK